MVLLLAISSYMPPQTSSISFPSSSYVSDIKSLEDLKRKDAQVGYRQGAFGKNLLISKVGLSDSQLVELSSEVEMVQKLRNGGKNGGVDALIAGIPYLKLLQSKHCQQFSLVPDLTLQSTGFGFVSISSHCYFLSTIGQNSLLDPSYIIYSIDLPSSH